MTVEPPVRYRMVGAIVLIFLAVLFLPWLFDGAGYEAMQDLEGPIPDRPAFVEPHTPPAPVPELRADQARDFGEDAASAGPSPEVSPPDPVPAARGRDAATAEAAGSRVGWSVQVGSFGREANARDQVQRLHEAGFTAFVERGTANGREVWRVKAGPRAERDEALRLRDDLRRKMDITGIVVAHP